MNQKEEKDLQANYAKKHIEHRAMIMQELHKNLDELGISSHIAYLNTICKSRFKVNNIAMLDNDNLMILGGIIWEKTEKKNK